jgi:hypothetical protein
LRRVLLDYPYIFLSVSIAIILVIIVLDFFNAILVVWKKDWFRVRHIGLIPVSSVTSGRGNEFRFLLPISMQDFNIDILKDQSSIGSIMRRRRDLRRILFCNHVVIECTYLYSVLRRLLIFLLDATKLIPSRRIYDA